MDKVLLKRKTKILIAVVMTFVLVATSTGTAFSDEAEVMGPPSPSENVYYYQIAGHDLYDTAAEAVNTFFKNRSYSTVIFASGESHADALSASGLAGLMDCPIMFTPRDTLHHTARQVLTGENMNVVIIGGKGAVSQKVEAEIAALPAVSSVERVGGIDCYDTARKVFEYGKTKGSGWDMKNAVVATGVDYPDAISVAPYAAYAGAPAFLAGSGGAIDDLTLECLAGINRVIIVGGNAVVSDGAADAIANLDDVTEVVRLAGKNLYQTNLKVVSFCADKSKYNPDFDPTTPPYFIMERYIASSTSYTDAIAVGVAASIQEDDPARMYLVGEGDSGLSMLDRYDNLDNYGFRFYFAGGKGAISQELRQKIIDGVGGKPQIRY